MVSEQQNKMSWLRPAMKGDDAGVIQGLLDTLPTSERLADNDLRQMAAAREFMAELFMRGISLQRFFADTGLTGFPIDPVQPGMERHQILGDCPIYFRFWLLSKDPGSSVSAIRNVLLARKNGMPEDYRGWYTLQVCIDVDTDDAQSPSPLDVGLTTKAVCFEVGLGDVESLFERIDRACQKLSADCRLSLRFTLGQWAQQEFDGMCSLSLFSKRMPYGMGAEWILFKKIHRLAGKFGWFWRMVDRRNDRKENG
jgi:hypothetical protein